MIERELLRARVELDPAGAGGQAALRLLAGVVGVRVDPAERDQQSV